MRESFSVNVTKKRMGTRVVNLTPLVASPKAKSARPILIF